MALILPVVIFALLLVPFMGVVPYLDGNVEFLVAHNFYVGDYFTHWMPYHPPLKPLMASLLFSMFGLSAYSLLGILLGVIGIVSIYAIAIKLFDKKTAILSSFLLSISGLYIATALFSLNDFLMTVFILAAYAFYLRKKVLWYALIVSMAVASKESAILFPLAIVIYDIWQRRYRWQHVIPFLFLGAWVGFVHFSGHTLWNEWNFSGDKKQGVLMTFFSNVVTLKLFNEYAIENWKHVFLFNYNWVFWVFVIPAIWKNRFKEDFYPVILFMFLYAIVILSFQTFTIPRYILPLIPFMLILTANLAVNLKYAPVFITILLVISLAALFTSNDPVSNYFWKDKTIIGKTFYLDSHDGIDGITYNLQFLELAKSRDVLIRTGFTQGLDKDLVIDQNTISLLNINK